MEALAARLGAIPGVRVMLPQAFESIDIAAG
jgi:hypothetical protein